MTSHLTAPPTPATRTVAFILVSYRPDEPAGMERAVAALSAGLRELGHRALILTAAPRPCGDAAIVRLRGLPVTFPCDDNTLRNAIQAHRTSIARDDHPLGTGDFGNLALESLCPLARPSWPTRPGTCPALLAGGAGALVPLETGPGGLWQAARNLLADPVRYRQACRAAYCRSRNYRPADIADAFLKAVW
jgi:hypothetical protein